MTENTQTAQTEQSPESRFVSVTPSSPDIDVTPDEDEPTAETTPDDSGPAEVEAEAEADVEVDANSETVPEAEADIEVDATDAAASKSAATPSTSTSEPTTQESPTEAAVDESEAQPETTSEDETASADGPVPAFVEATENTGAAAPLELVADREIFREFFSQVKAVADEAVIEFTDEKLATAVTDMANVFAIDAERTAEAFGSFSAGEYRMGVDVKFILDVLNNFDAGDEVSITGTEDRKLELKSNGLSFTTTPIDPDAIREIPEIPEIKQEIAVTADKAKLQQFIKAYEVLNPNAVDIEVSEEGVIGHAEADTDRATVSIADIDKVTTAQASIKSCTSKYDPDYLKPAVKGISGDTITMRIDEEVPLTLEGDYEDDAGSWEFMIAPRIST